MPVLTIIVASTRPGRVGAAVGRWFTPIAEAHGGFTVRVADLAELDLPLMDEPNHPRLQSYTHDHTKAWSAIVAGSDAFVFVMPEYNYSFTAPLKNALDYLFVEWQHKPVGLISYGGVSGGLRAAQMIKQVITTLSMMPLVEAVTIPMVASLKGEDGEIAGTELMSQSATAMLDSLVRWTTALGTLRPAVEDDPAGEA
ncbi:NAD(P)H-dependent oxidoreductase [Acidothermaceae bacterium B102]|nr:NAD(P)H-dependent oxidoreductase [Acidothermaceae bacterium B102]